jgi:alpha-tubulin suppressor-like RCC1 family protein
MKMNNSNLKLSLWLTISWGSNNDGKLGIGDDSVNKLIEPQLLDGFYKEKIVKIACGGEHSVALTSMNTWKLIIIWIIIWIIIFFIFFFNRFSFNHYLTYIDAGDVWVWGNGEYGQLSRQTKFHQSPFPIKLPKVSFERMWFTSP